VILMPQSRARRWPWLPDRSRDSTFDADGRCGPPDNFINPSNPQDRSGSSNRQDMTQPRAINPRVHDELRPARQRQAGFPHSQVDPPTTAMVPSACFNKYLTIH